MARAAPGTLQIIITGDTVEPVRSELGNFPDLVAAAIVVPWRAVLAVDDARTAPPPERNPAAIIVTGSPASVHHREPWMLRTEAWLRERVAVRTPILGICFGHQLLAQALGGRVTPNERGREIGTVAIERLTDDPLFDGLPTTFEANASHSDTVLEPPASAVVLARSSGDRHQVLRFGPRCYGVQFHPEFDDRVMRGYLLAHAAELRREGLDPDVLREQARATPAGSRIMRNFLLTATAC